MATKLDYAQPQYVLDIFYAPMQAAPVPIVSDRAPTANDLAQLGQTWVDKSSNAIYVLANITSSAAVWTTSPASGVGSFTALTVNPGNATITAGDLTVTAGNFDVTAGNTTLGGDLTVAGTTTLNGDIDLSTSALLDLTSTADLDPAILLDGNGGTTTTVRILNQTGTAADSIDIESDAGGITMRAELASADAINLEANNGGIDVNAALQMNLDSAQAAADAIRVIASDTAGGIDVDAGTGGIAVDTTGAYSIDGAAASNVSVSGAGIDLSLVSAAGRVVVNGEEAADDAVRILSAAGGLDVDVALQMSLVSSEAAADAIVINASGATAGIDITNDGSGDVDISSAGGLNLTSTEDAAGAVTVAENGGTSGSVLIQANQGSGAGSVTVNSIAGGLTLSAALASDDAINVNASAGGFDLDAALQINIDSAEAAADAIVITASDTAGGIDIISGTNGTGVTSTGQIDATSTANSAAAVSLTENGGTSGTILIQSQQGTGLNSIDLASTAGGARVTTAALAATTGLHVAQGAATAAIQVGSGAPSHAAPQGSLYLRTDGSSTSTRLYVNTDGSTTWTNFTSAA